MALKFYTESNLTLFIIEDLVYICTLAQTSVGDEVVVKFIDGGSGFITGVLTKKPEEEPSCSINGEHVDLATEGHSSMTYKVLGKFRMEAVGKNDNRGVM